MRNSSLHRIATAAVIFGSIAAGSCSSSNARSADAASSITATRENIAKSKDQINKTIASLQKLMDQQSGDLQPAYKEFSSNVATTNDLAAGVKKKAAAMREQGSEYFKNWEKESQSMKNPEIQQISAARKEEVQATFQKLTESMNGARDAFAPFLSDLNDIQKYLKNDLNPTGLQKLKPVSDRTVANGTTVNQNLDQILGILDEVSTKLAPKM